MSFTEADARRELPDVRVKLTDGTIITAYTMGRNNDFCSVWAKLPGFQNGIVIGEWSWKAIARQMEPDAKPLSM